MTSDSHGPRHVLDDDELLGVLGAAIAEADPVPSHVLSAARAVPEISALDAELALLSFDSELDAAGVRASGSSSRQVSFEAGHLEIEIVAEPEEHQGRRVVVLEGQIVPPSAVPVSLLSAREATGPLETMADDLGRFRFVADTGAPVRLVVGGENVGGRTSVVTSWFRP